MPNVQCNSSNQPVTVAPDTNTLPPLAPLVLSSLAFFPLARMSPSRTTFPCTLMYTTPPPLDVCGQSRNTVTLLYYSTDLDRDGHEISRFGGLPRVKFSQGIIFFRSAPRENITILAPPTRDISSVSVDICYIRWSK